MKTSATMILIFCGVAVNLLLMAGNSMTATRPANKRMAKMTKAGRGVGSKWLTCCANRFMAHSFAFERREQISGFDYAPFY